MRAVVYCRTSTLDQAREEKVSIPDQISWAKTYALENGWQWIKEYIEPGVTGDTEPQDRLALSQLLSDAAEDNFDILLIYHSSRLAREPDIGMRVCRVLGQLRKQVYFRNAPIDPVSPDKFAWGTNIGSQYMTAFSFIGDFQENVARSERVRAGFLGLAKRGKLVNAPYGYRKVPEFVSDDLGRKRYDWHFEVDEVESIIVKKIFDMYVNEGMSLRKVMLSLNSDLIPSPTGRVSNEAWSTATIRNILKDPAYIGKVRWGRKLGGKYLQGKSLTGKQRRVMTDESSWIITDGTHPKLIDDSLHNRAKEKLSMNFAIKGRAAASKGLLTGLVICDKCKRKAYFKVRKNKKYTYTDYVCSSYFIYKSCSRHLMTSTKLHGLIVKEISKLAVDITYRDKLIDKSRDSNLEKTWKTLENQKKEANQIRDKQFRILQAYEGSVLTLEQYGEAKRRLDEQETLLLKSIDQNTSIMSKDNSSNEKRAKFLGLLNNFEEKFNGLTLEQQKTLMHSLIESISVKTNKIDITYRL